MPATRTSYDTSIKHLCRLGLEPALPTSMLGQIPRSNINRWRHEPASKYLGCELNEVAKAHYDELVAYAKATHLRRVVRCYFRIVKVFHQTVLRVKGVKAALREAREEVVEAVERVRDVIPIKTAIKVFDFGRTTYQRWVLEVKAACDGSYFEWCNRAKPFQISRPEVHKIKEMLTDTRYQYWGIANIAAYAQRKGILPLSVSTWYKYAGLLGVHRPRPCCRRKKQKTGIRASQVNQIWHADVSLFKISRTTYYIYVVMDNFSRKVLSWEVATKLCQTIRLRTIRNAYKQALGIAGELNVALWVDGGPENNNRLIDRFIERSQIGIHKVIALRDVPLSNSMVEAIFKVLKYWYLYRMEIESLHGLRKAVDVAVQDYNHCRPHTSLKGSTPDEVYYGEEVDKSILESDVS